jgi:hypothetical protein
VKTMRPELHKVLEVLLVESEISGEVHIDRIGEALGFVAAGADDVDAMLDILEASGRKVVAPEGGGGELRLHAVITSARALTTVLGRKPKPKEIAVHAGLTEEEVRNALALAQVMGR